jgi:molybdopterin converting factor small subunit
MAQMLFFGPAKSISKTSRIEISAQDIREALDVVINLYGPELEKLISCSRVWLNGIEVDWSTQVTQSDEIAIIPPTSGG